MTILVIVTDGEFFSGNIRLMNVHFCLNNQSVVVAK